MRKALVRASTVSLHMTDAMELSELLDYLAQWLQGADESVRADLSTFAWDEGAMPLVRESLASFARLLICGHAHFDTDDLYDDPDDDLDSGADREQPW